MSFYDGAWEQAFKAHAIDGALGDAGISQDRVYRYWLKREWKSPAMSPRLPFIVLHATLADNRRDDLFIPKATSYAKARGYGGLEILALFAYRASSWNIVEKAQASLLDVVGPANDNFIANAMRFVRDVHPKAGIKPAVVFAWPDSASAERVERVTALAEGIEHLRLKPRA